MVSFNDVCLHWRSALRTSNIYCLTGMLQEVNLAYDSVKEVDCLDVSKEGTDAWEAAVKRSACLEISWILCVGMYFASNVILDSNIG